MLFRSGGVDGEFDDVVAGVGAAGEGLELIQGDVEDIVLGPARATLASWPSEVLANFVSPVSFSRPSGEARRGLWYQHLHDLIVAQTAGALAA